MLPRIEATGRRGRPPAQQADPADRAAWLREDRPALEARRTSPCPGDESRPGARDAARQAPAAGNADSRPVTSCARSPTSMPAATYCWSTTSSCCSTHRWRSTPSTCSSAWPTPAVSSRHGPGSIGKVAARRVSPTPRPAIRSTVTTPSMASSPFTSRPKAQHAAGSPAIAERKALGNEGIGKPRFSGPVPIRPARPIIAFRTDQDEERMRYGDLIQFEPIESVIQLLDANRPDEATEARLDLRHLRRHGGAHRQAHDPAALVRRGGRSQGRAGRRQLRHR